MKEFELGHTGDIGISKSKIFEMKRPKLEYAENYTLIHTYARKLEEYCDYLEECNNIVCSDMENLRESLDYELQIKIEKIERLEKALDKACELLVEAVSQDCTIFDEVIEEEYMWRTEIDEWKEWLLDEER